jgi:hypothetical protein
MLLYNRIPTYYIHLKFVFVYSKYKKPAPYQTLNDFSKHAFAKHRQYRHGQCSMGWPRETREGWSMLSETEANGDLWSTTEMDLLLGWFVRLLVSMQEIFFLPLAALVSPVQNIYSCHTLFHFTYVSPSPSNLGMQAVVPGRLSLNKCLWQCLLPGDQSRHGTHLLVHMLFWF